MRAAGIAVTLLLSCGGASAADLKTCAGVADNLQRLACYDRLAAEAASTPASSQPAVAAAPVAVSPMAAPSAAPVDQTAAFGAETVPRVDVDSSGTLRARMLGAFTGWRPGTVFELDNGQAWKSIDTDREEHDPIQAPQVTIEKGLANYWMKVEGQRRGFKVRRVR